MSACPGCGRCNVCGRPHPAPAPANPWPKQHPPNIPWRQPYPYTPGTYSPQFPPGGSGANC